MTFVLVQLKDAEMRVFDNCTDVSECTIMGLLKFATSRTDYG